MSASLFFSYSHRDEDLRNELEMHLSALQRQGFLSTWHDRRINVGGSFDKEISDHLEKADIVLLLVSPYFIASEYCYGTEMVKAMERHRAGKAKVVPVILHPCDWHDLPFGKLLATPKDGRPVSKFPNLHDAFLDITLAIKDVVKSSKSSILDVHSNKDVDGGQVLASISQASSSPRSGNLRIKKEFTEREKDKFLQEAFEYIARYFEASLQELDQRNSNIEIDFRRLDGNHFSAAIYKGGRKESSCKVWLSGRGAFGNGIAYSIGEHSGDNSLNDLLSVLDDGNILFLKPLMSSLSHSSENKFSMEGGAEYYWARFVEPLQR